MLVSLNNMTSSGLKTNFPMLMAGLLAVAAGLTALLLQHAYAPTSPCQQWKQDA